MESMTKLSALAAATPLSLLLYATACTTRATRLIYLLLPLIPLIVSCVLLLRPPALAVPNATGARRPRRGASRSSATSTSSAGSRTACWRALAESHGPVMLLRLRRVRAVVVSSADAAREVMRAQDHAFATRPSLAIPRRLLYGCTDIAFAPHGPYWRGARKMAVRHLLGPSRVRAYRAVREQEVDALVRRVAEHDGHGVVRLSELLSGFAKDVAGRIVLGVRAGGDQGWRDKIDANVLLATFHVGDYIPWLSWVSAVDGTDARVTKAFQRIDRILDEIVEDWNRARRRARRRCLRARVAVAAEGIGRDRAAPLSKDNVKALLERDSSTARWTSKASISSSHRLAVGTGRVRPGVNLSVHVRG
ncbi:hypothetical protein EJB05_43761, partial [Eragrostis curvula]